jgi:hypothetical protein
MVFTFSRVRGARAQRRGSVPPKKRMWVRLHEKGGKVHDMPTHHMLEEYLSDYLEAAALPDRPSTPLFQSFKRRPYGRGTPELSGRRLSGRNLADGAAARKRPGLIPIFVTIPGAGPGSRPTWKTAALGKTISAVDRSCRRHGEVPDICVSRSRRPARQLPRAQRALRFQRRCIAYRSKFIRATSREKSCHDYLVTDIHRLLLVEPGVGPFCIRDPMRTAGSMRGPLLL